MMMLVEERKEVRKVYAASFGLEMANDKMNKVKF